MIDYSTNPSSIYRTTDSMDLESDLWDRVVNEVMKEAVTKEFEDTEKHMSEQGDNVNHPNYYNKGEIEVIDAIDDWGLGFCLGNAIKYIARAGNKYPDKKVEDLKKAIWYIQHEIDKNE